jgi:RNA-binding protein YlmH
MKKNNSRDRIEDWINISIEKNRVINSYFLNQEELALAKKQIANRVDYLVIAGHQNYERAKILFNSTDEFKSDIVLLKAEYDKRYDDIDHSDILGSLMNLNIERKMIGDIVVQDSNIFIFTNNDLAKYIIDNCTKIKKSVISFSKSNEVFSRVVNLERLMLNVSSLRLDSIVSGLTHLSRDKAQKLILNKQVSINHIVLEDVKKICHNNDTISIRKYGRFIFQKVEKVTKKDRLLIECSKYS